MSATTVFSDSTWQALAAEYNEALSPDLVVGDRIAEQNARLLAEHVAGRVEVSTLPDGRMSVSGWVPVEDPEPYESFEDMRADFMVAISHPSTLRMVVSDMYHDHPVFSREDNLRFRVWHDTAHLVENLGFTPNEEVELFQRQALGIESPRVRAALFCESVYQLAASVVLGEFPDRQAVRTPGPVGRAVLDAWGL